MSRTLQKGKMRKHCSKSGMSAFLGKGFPWCEIAESPLAAVGSGMGVRQLRNNLDQLKFVSTNFGNNWVKVMNDCREGQPMVPWPWAAPTWQKVNGESLCEVWHQEHVGGAGYSSDQSVWAFLPALHTPSSGRDPVMG